MTVSEVTTSSFASLFPSASMVLIGDGLNMFVSKDEDVVYTHGSASDFSEVVLDAPLPLIEYPISISTDWTASVSGMNQTDSQTVNTSSVAVGFGTLLLPWGQLENVLKVHSYSTTTRFGDILIVSVDTMELYYSNNFPWYVARTLKRQRYVGVGIPDPEFSFLYAGENSFVGIAEQQHNGMVVKAFPNPASDMVIIAAMGHSQGTQVQVFDAAGRSVQLGKLVPKSNLVQLDVSSWESGLYVVRVKHADGSNGSARFIVNN